MLIAAVACWGLGCAGASSNVSVTEFRSSDAALFDGAMDLVSEPVIVDGAQGTLERRVSRSDVVASIRVHALHSELVKRRSAYRLTARVKERLKGEAPRELELRVSDQEPGYRTIQRYEDRLLREPFIAFVKWELVQGEAAPVARWHLSPDSEGVREKIDYVLRRPATYPHTDEGAVEGR
jgi:hypothetical protein